MWFRSHNFNSEFEAPSHFYLHIIHLQVDIDVWFEFSCSSLFILQNGTKLRIAGFVHGADGLGNQNFPPPKGKPIEQSAADFLIEQAKLYPGKVTVVALGPLTNIALVRVPDHLAWSLILNIIHYILNYVIHWCRLSNEILHFQRTLDRLFFLVVLF